MGGVDVGLLKKNCNARLNSNELDKEAKRGAIEKMLKNWKENIPYQRCDTLQKELSELRSSLKKKMSISSSSLNEEVDKLL